MVIEIAGSLTGIPEPLELVEFEPEDASLHLLQHELVLCAKVFRVFPVTVGERHQLIPPLTLRPLGDTPAGASRLVRVRVRARFLFQVPEDAGCGSMREAVLPQPLVHLLVAHSTPFAMSSITDARMFAFLYRFTAFGFFSSA